MRITVVGATGGTGREVVRQALDAGHEVTPVVRTPGRLDPRVEELVADVFDPAALGPAIEGRDAVISAMGPRGRGPTTVCRDSAAAITKAMAGAGVSRLVVVSASGFHPEGEGPLSRYVIKPLISRIFRHEYADLAAAEQVVTASGLRWTLLLPPRLTDKQHTGRYRTTLGGPVVGGATISRADLADGAVRCLDDAASVQATLGLAN